MYMCMYICMRMCVICIGCFIGQRQGWFGPRHVFGPLTRPLSQKNTRARTHTHTCTYVHAHSLRLSLSLSLSHTHLNHNNGASITSEDVDTGKKFDSLFLPLSPIATGAVHLRVWSLQETQRGAEFDGDFRVKLLCMMLSLSLSLSLCVCVCVCVCVLVCVSVSVC